jgi:hypothetical protein
VRVPCGDILVGCPTVLRARPEAPVERWMSNHRKRNFDSNAWHWDDDSRGRLRRNLTSLEGTCMQSEKVRSQEHGPVTDRGHPSAFAVKEAKVTG